MKAILAILAAAQHLSGQDKGPAKAAIATIAFQPRRSTARTAGLRVRWSKSKRRLLSASAMTCLSCDGLLNEREGRFALKCWGAHKPLFSSGQ
jgi:hypothetical protein